MRVAGSKPLLNAQIMDQSVIGKSTTTTTNYLPYSQESTWYLHLGHTSSLHGFLSDPKQQTESPWMTP